MEPEGSLPCSQGPTNSEALSYISYQAGFYSEKLLAPRPTPKSEDHISPAIRDHLFNIISSTLYIWRPSLPSTSRGRAMPSREIHITWLKNLKCVVSENHELRKLYSNWIHMNETCRWTKYYGLQRNIRIYIIISTAQVYKETNFVHNEVWKSRPDK
jgi:hypothetical protein